MKKILIAIMMLLLTASLVSASWSKTPDQIVGLGDVGDYSAPTFYTYKGIEKLIVGEYREDGKAANGYPKVNGEFFGFEWDGTQYTKNNNLVKGLSVDYYNPQLTTWHKNKNLDILFIGDLNGHIKAYKMTGKDWNKGKWKEIPKMTTGLPQNIVDPYPAIVEIGKKTYMVLTSQNCGVYAYQFKDGQWIENKNMTKGIKEGLKPDESLCISQAASTTIGKDILLMISNQDGKFFTYTYQKNKWVRNDDFMSGLTRIYKGGYMPTFYQRNGNLYMLIGNLYGNFDAFKWI